MLLDDFLLTYLVFMSTNDLCEALLGQYPYNMPTVKTVTRPFGLCVVFLLSPWPQSPIAAHAAGAKRKAKTPSSGSARFCGWSPTGAGYIRTSWRKRSTSGASWRYGSTGVYYHQQYLFMKIFTSLFWRASEEKLFSLCCFCLKTKQDVITNWVNIQSPFFPIIAWQLGCCCHGNQSRRVDKGISLYGVCNPGDRCLVTEMRGELNFWGCGGSMTVIKRGVCVCSACVWRVHVMICANSYCYDLLNVYGVH